MNAPYNQDVLAAAEACFAQASQLLYCEPDAEVVADQVAERPFQNAPFGMDDADVREGMALMDAWCVAAAADEAGFDERVAALRREWLRLFVGAGTPDAPSWESFYRDPNSQLFSARTLEVRERYRRHGLQIERLYAEPDDHLGLMLGFVGHLIGLEAEALAVGDGAAAGEAADEQESFLVEHVLPWLAALQRRCACVVRLLPRGRRVRVRAVRALRTALRRGVRPRRAGVQAEVARHRAVEALS